MYIKSKLHRYSSRHFLYPAFCIILLFLLIRWYSSPQSGPTGTRFDEFNIMSIKPEQQSELDNLQIAKPIDDEEQLKVIQEKVKGNIISLEIYMEAQCPDTTGFFKRQLLPSWDKLGPTKRVNISLIPAGKAQCEEEKNDYKCTCQHGYTECDLNELMNCVIERLPDPDKHIPIIGCIQGRIDFSTAFKNCIEGNSEAEWLKECGRGKHGRYLLNISAQRTSGVKDFNFVPWVRLNGQRVNDAFYALEENLCKRLDPKPNQCEHFA